MLQLSQPARKSLSLGLAYILVSLNSGTPTIFRLSPLNLLVPLVGTSVMYIVQLVWLALGYGFFITPGSTLSPYLLVDFLLYLATSYAC